MIHPIRFCLIALTCLALAACGRLPASGPASNEILSQVAEDNNEFAVYRVTRAFLPTVEKWPVTGKIERIGWNQWVRMGASASTACRAVRSASPPIK